MSQQQLVHAPRRVTRTLPVKLSEHELAQAAKEMGRLRRERHVMGAQMKQVQAQWKDRIAGLDARIADLAQQADEGVEDREVPCEEIFDYRLGEVRVQRLDTHETLEVRPMTAAERQPELFTGSASIPDDVDDDEGSAGDIIYAADVEEPAEEEGDVTDPQAVLDAEPFPEAGTGVKRRRKPQA